MNEMDKSLTMIRLSIEAENSFAERNFDRTLEVCNEMEKVLSDPPEMDGDRVALYMLKSLRGAALSAKTIYETGLEDGDEAQIWCLGKCMEMTTHRYNIDKVICLECGEESRV